MDKYLTIVVNNKHFKSMKKRKISLLRANIEVSEQARVRERERARDLGENEPVTFRKWKARKKLTFIDNEMIIIIRTRVRWKWMDPVSIIFFILFLKLEILTRAIKRLKDYGKHTHTMCWCVCWCVCVCHFDLLVWLGEVNVLGLNLVCFDD